MALRPWSRLGLKCLSTKCEVICCFTLSKTWWQTAVHLQAVPFWSSAFRGWSGVDSFGMNCAWPLTSPRKLRRWLSSSALALGEWCPLSWAPCTHHLCWLRGRSSTSLDRLQELFWGEFGAKSCIFQSPQRLLLPSFLRWSISLATLSRSAQGSGRGLMNRGLAIAM